MNTELPATRTMSPGTARVFVRIWVEIMCFLPAAAVGGFIFLMYFALGALLLVHFLAEGSFLSELLRNWFPAQANADFTIDEHGIARLYGYIMIGYVLISEIFRRFRKPRPPTPFLRTVAAWSLPVAAGWGIFYALQPNRTGFLPVLVFFAGLTVAAIAVHVALNRFGTWLLEKIDPPSAILMP